MYMEDSVRNDRRLEHPAYGSERLSYVSNAVAIFKTVARCKQMLHDGWKHRTQNWYQQEVQNLVPKCDKFLNYSGDYVEM